MKVLITGIAGFVGSHFTEYFLAKKNIDIYGIERWKASTENIAHLKDKIKLYDECDINDIVSMRDILKKVKPDFIIHLAAQSFVPTSWTAPAETIKTNMIGEVNLFEALRSLKLNPRIIVAGSSEEYGFVIKSELPIKETHPLRPLS
ncbi:MAG: GDP-mannose 4,6-dehydratase, partial [Candidatus Omnitrophota bacterium]